jgi:hypothetical protein
MNVQNQFNKMFVFECQTISENIHKLRQEQFKDFRVFLYKFQDIQGLEFLFSNSRTFKDIQGLSRFVRTLSMERLHSFPVTNSTKAMAAMLVSQTKESH